MVSLFTILESFFTTRRFLLNGRDVLGDPWDVVAVALSIVLIGVLKIY